jgi:hypothetical protein
VLPVTGALTVGVIMALDRRWPGSAARWGMAVGAAAMPLFIAYNNRHGPGTYCHAFGTPPYQGQSCGEEWDPRPWLVIGLGLIAIGFIGALWDGRRRCRASAAVGTAGAS